MTYLTIRSKDDATQLLDEIRNSAQRTQNWLAAQSAEPLELFRMLKFERVGCHPLEDRQLNVVEQINQTWTYLVALLAAKQLLDLHPGVGELRLAPGAHASLELDIMSADPGLIGAEAFAAVDPTNNDKLQCDLSKLMKRTEQHRYVFFMSPSFRGNQRLEQFEKDGVQVWSVDL
ncbi:MAG: hypothetical protein RLZ98_1221 [Pseudomonadota bacterium]|jgi:hypothetical protein